MPYKSNHLSYRLIIIKTVIATNYKEIPNSNGLVAFKLQTVKVQIGYERTLHTINLTSLEAHLQNIENIITSFRTIEHLEQTLWDKIKIAKDKLYSLIPHRTKRGLVDALGTAIKFIAGNPDNNDLEILHRSLGILKTQGNKLVTNQLKQIRINELFANKLNNISNSLNMISSRISKQYNTVEDLKADLEFINLIWNVDKIIHILEDIEEQIEFARLGLINKNILSLEEKQFLFDKLRRQNLNLYYLDELFQYTSASVGISKTQATLLVKTPILDPRAFDLLELHTLRVNNTRIDTYINLVAKHGNTVYYQQSRCNICDNSNLIEDDCIYNILTQQTPTCKMMKTKQTTTVKEITQGVILIDPTETVEIKDSCGNSRMVREAIIIETTNCTIKIRNLTFNGKPDVTHQKEYLIPIYSKPLQNGNLSEIDTEDDRLQFQNLEDLNEVQLSLDNFKRRLTIGGGSLLALTILCFFTLFFFYKKATSRMEDKALGTLPELRTVIQTKDIHEDIWPTESKPEKANQKFIPIPRIGMPKTSTEDA